MFIYTIHTQGEIYYVPAICYMQCEYSIGHTTGLGYSTYSVRTLILLRWPSASGRQGKQLSVLPVQIESADVMKSM